MDQASRTLLELGQAPELYRYPTAELLPLHLAAADAVVAERRQQVPILDRRAREAGVDRISRKSDLVPLLFPHSTYKSYPATFVEKKRWKDLARWLTTLSADDVTGVDFDGVTDEDEWVDRLRENGHFVIATSGTTGKCSFLRHSAEDRARKAEAFARQLGWRHERELLVADSPQEWAQAIDRLNNDANLWHALRSAALEAVSRDASPAIFTERITATLAELAPHALLAEGGFQPPRV